MPDNGFLVGQGIRHVENLEEYTGLRVIWLEGNGLSKLEGMEAQTEMRTLYAHENLIEKIEGLDTLCQVSSLVRALRPEVVPAILNHQSKECKTTCFYPS